MAYGDLYKVGTLSVGANGTAVTGTGTAWATGSFALRKGDHILAAGHRAVIEAVNSDTSLTLAIPWTGGALTNAAYVAEMDAASRNASAAVASTLQSLMSQLSRVSNAGGRYICVSVGQNAPPSTPAEGEMYVVGTAPTGAWAGYANYMAKWLGFAWQFWPPTPGEEAKDITSGLIWLCTSLGTWSPNSLLTGAVRYDTVQSLTAPQKTQALTNVGLALTSGVAGATQVATQASLDQVAGSRRVFDSYAAAQAASLPISVQIVELLGYSGPGDGGEAHYKRVASEPSHQGKFQSADGAWWEIRRKRLRLEMFGAVGTGSANDKAALERALTVGRRIVGDWQTVYGVSGNVELPALADLFDLRFRQLAPNTANCRTLFSNGKNGVRLYRVQVDRNGDGTQGALFTHAGIQIYGGSGHKLEDVEVFGNDMGNGLHMIACTDFEVIRPNVHDINYVLGSNPGDDRIHGILFQLCTDFRVTSPKVRALGGNFGSGATTRWSRGIAFGGCVDFEVMGGRVRDVDQGVDITGSDGNGRFRFVGTEVMDCWSWGFKCANSAYQGTFVACHGIRCGYAPFVVSGAVEAGLPLPGRIDFIACQGIDTGSNGAWAAQMPTAFLIMQGSFDISYPRPVRFIDCSANDNQATKTMAYGYRNQVTGTAAGQPFNECRNCTSTGHTVAATLGFGFPAVLLKRTADQSIPSSNFTNVQWTSEAYDGALMHSTSANIDIVQVPRAGWYQVSAKIGFAGNATGSRTARLVINGVADDSTATTSPGLANDQTLTITTTRYLTAGNGLSLQVWHNSGSDLAVRGAFTTLEVVEIMSQAA